MPNSVDLIIANRFHSETVAKLDNSYNTHHLWKLSDKSKQQLIRSLNGKCHAVATASWHCDPRVYELSSLELISCFGVGVDGIDFNLARQLNAKVCNTPDVLNDAVADIAMGLILSITRNLVNADRYVRDKSWQTEGAFKFGQDLKGKVLGIAGLGRIGNAIAQRAIPFGLQIAYHNRNALTCDYQYCADLSELASRADILLCMLPGGEETRHLINDDIINKLGEDGYFINVGRGTSVDEKALASALSEGRIAGAGLDVYENEPFVTEALLNQSNVVLLPHIGSATEQTREAMGQLVMDNLDAYFAGNSLISEYHY